MDELKPHEYENVSFPNLIEITGYLMLYRLNGFKSLNQLFPNLAVIRGRDLFKDYALIIYEMLDLADIGLKNLMKIERGNVRIEKNENTCYIHTINWDAIVNNHTPYFDVSKNILWHFFFKLISQKKLAKKNTQHF